MGLCCGVIGLANVGKTTVFNALVAGHALAANYPFATVEPNIGVAGLVDPRLDHIGKIYGSKKITPSTLEVRDIAGLVQGASQGEGLGNQFLAQIREVDALLHVVRCFTAPDVVHVAGSVDPARDIETVEIELRLADLEALERRLERVAKKARAGEAKAGQERELLDRLREALQRGEPPSHRSLSQEEHVVLKELQLLTAKPVLFVANVSEGAMPDDPTIRAVDVAAASRGAPVLALCGRLEADLASLPPQEREEYLHAMGFSESALSRLTRVAYDLLGLITFFTANEHEARAWPIRRGTKAAEAAGKIHSDMERGFIRAEVIRYQDLLTSGSVAAVREKGWFRLEGKDYEIQEGDVVYVRFHV